MKLLTQIYILFAILVVFCINAAHAVSIYSGPSGTVQVDTTKIARISDLQDKVKVFHHPLENQVRIETEFPAASQLTAEIINMIGVSCQKTNFRANTTLDYTLKPGIYFVVVYLNNQRIYSSKILVSQ